MTYLPLIVVVCAQAIVPLASRPDSARLSRDLFGACVEAAGDRDVDGVQDLWIGDPSMRGGELAAPYGKVWLVSGADGATLLRIDGPAAAHGFGWSLAAIGDLDGDERGDVAIGSRLVTNEAYLAHDLGIDAVPGREGAVFVCSGRTGTLLRRVGGPADAIKAWGDSTNAGPALAALDDWNADGVEDFAIGWSYADAEAEDLGRVEVVSGKDGAVIRSWLGVESHDRFGASLARLPDIDGDGVADLAAGAMPDRARAGYVQIVSSKGPVIRTLRPSDGGRTFGRSLCVLPSERPELLIGQPDSTVGRIAVTRWNLRDGACVLSFARPWIDEWARKSEDDVGHELPKSRGDSEGSFGTRLLLVPDRDRDGIRDVLVTSPDAFSASPGGILSTGDGKPLGLVSIAFEPFDDAWHPQIGIGASGAGDVDRDGIEDLAISGASVRCGECTGAVVLVSGRTLRSIRYFVRAGRE